MTRSMSDMSVSVNESTSIPEQKAPNPYIVSRSRVHGGRSVCEVTSTTAPRASMSTLKSAAAGPPRRRVHSPTRVRSCPRIVPRTLVETTSTSTMSAMMSRVTPNNSG